MTIMTNESAFARFFEPRMATCPKITLDEEQIKIVQDFVAQKWKRKIQEYPHDAKNIIERNIIGHLCEFGLLTYFGKAEYFDDSIGDSWDYHYPDLWNSPKNKQYLSSPKIPADIKGSRLKNTPLVQDHKVIVLDGVKCLYPIVICVSDYKTVWILGIASPEVVYKYSSETLIKNANNPDKTAFYGADKLIDIPKTWDELRTACKSLVTKI